MQVGDEIWCNDYRSNRTPWFKGTITGETRQSWLVSDYKINKKTMLENQGQWGTRRWHTEESMNEIRWLNQNKHKIAQRVEQCRDIALLKQIAVLVGYEDAPAMSNGER